MVLYLLIKLIFMTRKELVLCREYVLAEMQVKLHNLFEGYLDGIGLKRRDLAGNLNITDRQVNEIMDLDYDQKMSKMIELALSIKKVPIVFFVDAKDFVDADEKDMEFALTTVQNTYTY
jgi:hypothetical protein